MMIRINEKVADFVLCDSISERLDSTVSDFIVAEIDSGQCLCEKVKM
jgi:hypothetical protein